MEYHSSLNRLCYRNGWPQPRIRTLIYDSDVDGYSCTIVVNNRLFNSQGFHSNTKTAKEAAAMAAFFMMRNTPKSSGSQTLLNSCILPSSSHSISKSSLSEQSDCNAPQKNISYVDPKCYIMQLPTELLLEISSYLHSFGDLASLIRTSRRFSAAIPPLMGRRYVAHDFRKAGQAYWCISYVAHPRMPGMITLRKFDEAEVNFDGIYAGWNQFGDSWWPRWDEDSGEFLRQCHIWGW